MLFSAVCVLGLNVEQFNVWKMCVCISHTIRTNLYLIQTKITVSRNRATKTKTKKLNLVSTLEH